MYTTPTGVLLWLPFLWGAAYAPFINGPTQRETDVITIPTRYALHSYAKLGAARWCVFTTARQLTPWDAYFGSNSTNGKNLQPIRHPAGRIRRGGDCSLTDRVHQCVCAQVAALAEAPSAHLAGVGPVAVVCAHVVV